jgi:hypothetical protein
MAKVKNLAAFEIRYGFGFGLPVAGEWESGQNPSNGGERLKLSYGAGTAIHDFEYDDNAPWPGEADGTESVLIRSATPISAKAKQFFRIKVFLN